MVSKLRICNSLLPNTKSRHFQGILESRNAFASSRLISATFIRASEPNNTVSSASLQNASLHRPGVYDELVYGVLWTFLVIFVQVIDVWRLWMHAATESGPIVWQSSECVWTFFQWLLPRRVFVNLARPDNSSPTFSKCCLLKLAVLCLLGNSFQIANAQSSSCSAGYFTSGGVCALCPTGSCCLGGSSSASACIGSLAQGAAVSAGDLRFMK